MPNSSWFSHPQTFRFASILYTSLIYLMPHSVPVRKIRWMQRDMVQKSRKIRRNQSTAVHLGVRLPAAASTAIGGHDMRRASLVVVTVPPGIALRREQGTVAARW